MILEIEALCSPQVWMIYNLLFVVMCVFLSDIRDFHMYVWGRRERMFASMRAETVAGVIRTFLTGGSPEKALFFFLKYAKSTFSFHNKSIREGTFKIEI